jgi:hypothetical protein
VSDFHFHCFITPSIVDLAGFDEAWAWCDEPDVDDVGILTVFHRDVRVMGTERVCLKCGEMATCGEAS